MDIVTICKSFSFSVVSRLCKKSLFTDFSVMCRNLKKDNILDADSYRQVKDKAENYQDAKKALWQKFRSNKAGEWVLKPQEIDLFQAS